MKPKAKTRRKLKQFVVRTNCEYSVQVEAASADAAIAMVEHEDVAEWAQAWSEIEAEEK